VTNGDFSSGAVGWRSFFSPVASFSVVGGVARVAITTQTTNGQLYQAPIALQQGVSYRVQFRARNTKGDNVTVQVIKDASPFTLHGSSTFDLGPTFQSFEFTFTPAAPAPDSRLMFFFSPHDTDNTQYELDDVVLEQVSCP
jgi:hypothetical protein